MKDAYIVSAVRTAIGRLGGSLCGIKADELSALVMKEAGERAGMDAACVDEVIFGQVRQNAEASNIARVAALLAGFPETTPGYTLTRACGSSMQAIHNAAQGIACGLYDVVLAGGVESMSNAEYYLTGARYGYRVGSAQLLDSLTESQFHNQPTSIYGSFMMGETAENLAERYGISREEQDAFSLESQLRAAAAISEGRFKDEILPVSVPQKKADPILFDTDEHPRSTSLEKLAKLKPAFKPDGTVTAGNSSGRNDGASCTVVMSEEGLKKTGAKPMARIVSQAVAAVDPRVMGIGPVYAVKKALERAGLGISDIGLVELNEAFAAQSIAVLREIPFDRSIVNVNGGAIALGHPLGASGARIVTTLLYEMERRGVRYGLATLCIGGGQGIATVFERV